MTAPIAKESGDWRPLKSWLITQIHADQRSLESDDPTVPERTHATTRGRIQAFRKLIEAVEPAVRLQAEKLEEADLDSTAGY